MRSQCEHGTVRCQGVGEKHACDLPVRSWDDVLKDERAIAEAWKARALAAEAKLDAWLKQIEVDRVSRT